MQARILTIQLDLEQQDEAVGEPQAYAPKYTQIRRPPLPYYSPATRTYERAPEPPVESHVAKDTHDLRWYVAAGVAYIGIGVFVPELLFSWFEGAAFLILVVAVLPRLFRR
jgi:hypothetical protein